MGGRELDSTGSGPGRVAGSCEKGTEVLGSIKQSFLTSWKLFNSPERLCSMPLVYILLTEIPSTLLSQTPTVVKDRLQLLSN